MQSWVHVCGGWCRLISHYQCVVNCEQDCTEGCCFIAHATVNLPHFYWTCMKLQWETSICSACKYSPINFNSYEPDLLEAARPNPEWLLCKQHTHLHLFKYMHIDTLGLHYSIWGKSGKASCAWESLQLGRRLQTACVGPCGTLSSCQQAPLPSQQSCNVLTIVRLQISFYWLTQTWLGF